MITSVEEMIKQYVASWNEKGLEEFKTAFATCWAAHATYTDPNFALVKGVEGIAGLAQASLEKMPTRIFHVLTLPDYHHNYGRYMWDVVLPEETRQGFDFFEYSDEYKITRLISFFGPLQEVE